MYLWDSGDGTITKGTDADEEFCFDKKKIMRKGKQCTPRKKYPKPKTEPKFDKNIFVIHKQLHSNSNAIDHIENLFQQRRKTSIKKTGAYCSNPGPKKLTKIPFLSAIGILIVYLLMTSQNLHS